MNKRDQTVLRKIRDECAVIASFIDGYSEAEFLNDEMMSRGVCMTLISKRFRINPFFALFTFISTNCAV
jgi:hypothetical protein